MLCKHFKCIWPWKGFTLEIWCLQTRFIVWGLSDWPQVGPDYNQMGHICDFKRILKISWCVPYLFQLVLIWQLCLIHNYSLLCVVGSMFCLLFIKVASMSSVKISSMCFHPQMGLYNFRPSVRPIPMEVHVKGFPGQHYCPRMATMNKPCFQGEALYSSSRSFQITKVACWCLIKAPI